MGGESSAYCTNYPPISQIKNNTTCEILVVISLHNTHYFSQKRLNEVILDGIFNEVGVIMQFHFIHNTSSISADCIHIQR